MLLAYLLSELRLLCAMISDCWLTRLLKLDVHHPDDITANLTLFETDAVRFLEVLLTDEECCVHHFVLETKDNS